MTTKAQTNRPGCFRSIVDVFQIIGAVAGVFSVLIAIVALIYAVRNPERVVEIVRIVAGVTPSPTAATPMPTETLLPTVTPMPTETPTVTPSPSPTSTHTVTPTPTITPSPTNTPTPTQTPTPIPEPGTVLLSDDFEAGFDKDTWEIVSGSPFVVGGRLTSNDGMMIVVDVGWPNYTISFDAGNLACRPMAANTEDTVELIVRYANRDNYLSMITGCNRRWIIKSDGRATTLEHASFSLPPIVEGLWHIEATVQGDQFTAQDAETLFLDRVGNATKVGIHAEGGITIDNFTVVSLP